MVALCSVKTVYTYAYKVKRINAEAAALFSVQIAYTYA